MSEPFGRPWMEKNYPEALRLTEEDFLTVGCPACSHGIVGEHCSSDKLKFTGVHYRRLLLAYDPDEYMRYA